MHGHHYKLGTKCMWDTVNTVDGVMEKVKIPVKIVGLATTGMPVIGVGYVIELPLKVPFLDYPYTHTVAFECHLEEIHD